MKQTDILWDSLTGELMTYVENYKLSKRGRIAPSYKVDYEISDSIMGEIDRSIRSKTKNADDVWYRQIMRYKDIKKLPEYLKELISQFLPRFLNEHPEYRDSEELKL